MKPFINDDFLLQTNTARELFSGHARKMPIIDFHNHLNPQEIYEDRCYDNIAQVWLGGDHYKWRAMRANGIPEQLITGGGQPYEKFLAWADTVQNCIGNPLYHWTHLELKRYFDIDETLSPDTAKDIWDICNRKLRSPQYSVRNLLNMQNVKVLCTTDDPVDDLIWHKKLAQEQSDFQVLPTFRPGNALDIEKDNFPSYVACLGSVSQSDVSSLDGLTEALKKRLDFFISAGCRVTDHSLENSFYLPASYETANGLYQKRLTGVSLSSEEAAMYRGFLLTELGRELSLIHI